jgi:hypothetical protein
MSDKEIEERYGEQAKDILFIRQRQRSFEGFRCQGMISLLTKQHP